VTLVVRAAATRGARFLSGGPSGLSVQSQTGLDSASTVRGLSSVAGARDPLLHHHGASSLLPLPIQGASWWVIAWCQRAGNHSLASLQQSSRAAALRPACSTALTTFLVRNLEPAAPMVVPSALGDFVGTWSHVARLTATHGLALLTGLTFGMDPKYAIIILLCVTVVPFNRRSRSSILLNIPGTPPTPPR